MTQAISSNPIDSNQLLSSKIPEKRCCTDLTISKIAISTLATLGVLACTAAVTFTVWTFVPTLVILCIFLIIFAPWAIYFLASLAPQWKLKDYQNPKVFKETLEDLRRSSFHKILKTHQIDRLFHYQVISRAAKEKMKFLEIKLFDLKQKFKSTLAKRKDELSKVPYISHYHEKWHDSLDCKRCDWAYDRYKSERNKVKEKYSKPLEEYYKERAEIDSEFYNFLRPKERFESPLQ